MTGCTYLALESVSVTGLDYFCRSVFIQDCLFTVIALDCLGSEISSKHSRQIIKLIRRLRHYLAHYFISWVDSNTFFRNITMILNYDVVGNIYRNHQHFARHRQDKDSCVTLCGILAEAVSEIILKNVRQFSLW